LHMLTREKTETIGCGRTDTGVHAKMFFAHFDTSKSIPALRDKDQFIHQINCILPTDIAVQGVFQTADDAHARFDATSRTYEYHLYSFKDPFLADNACFIPYEIEVERMNDLCEVLLESAKDAIDYGCFSKNRTQTKQTIAK
jgi:tRNA pseudouridine38-40 synthase